jgi:cytoskeletal protein CcmA (bactofilin family)
MFSRRKSKSSASANLPAVSTAPSIIVSDLNISGDLVSQGSIEIGGKVKGNVKCNNVVIRKESRVDGDIYADSLVIKGVVKGIVYAEDIIIDDTGVFEGQINYKNITTSPGASINGILNRVDKAATEEVITDSDSFFGKDKFSASDFSDKEEGSFVDDNSEDGLEYIPSISTLMDKIEGESKSDVLEEDSGKDISSDLTEVGIGSLKGIKATKKASILDSDVFSFTPPTSKKNKHKKSS